MPTVGELVAVLRADTAQFTASMEKASAETAALKGETEGFSRVASTAFIAAGAAAAIGIAKVVDATVAWARSVKSIQLVTGQTAESASALLAVSEQFGLSSTQLATGLGLLEKNAANGAKGLEKYGIATRDAQGNLLPFDDLLGNVIDKYGSLATQADKTAFAMNVFGRSGKSLIPILKQGRDGLAALEAEAAKTGLVIGQGTVDAAVNLGIAERKLGEAFKGAEVSIGTQFLPMVTRLVTDLTGLVEAINKIPAPVKAAALGFIVFNGAVTGLRVVLTAANGMLTKNAALLGAHAKVAEEDAAATGLDAEAQGASEAATVANTTTIGAQIVALQARNVALAQGNASTLMAVGPLKALNAPIIENIAGMYGLYKGTQDAISEWDAFKAGNYSDAVSAITNELHRYTGGVVAALPKTDSFAQGLQAVQQQQQAGTITNQQASDAVHALSDQYGIQLPAAVYASVMAFKQSNAQIQVSVDNAKSLQRAISGAKPLLQQMGTSFQDLSAGMTTAFSTAQQSGQDTTAALQDFADQQIAAAQKARQAFEDQARSALTFTTSMLSALEQTAQQADQTLAGGTKGDTAAQLQQLHAQANITAKDILNTFQAATTQTKQFGQNLLEISRVGGKAGKDLANSLMASGDVLSAQVIADAPAKLQREIVHAFGGSEHAANKYSKSLTDAIVGPLNKISSLLRALASQVFGVHLTLNNGDPKKKTDEMHHGFTNLQTDVDHLVAHPYGVKLSMQTAQAERQLHTFDTTLNNFLAQKRTIDVGVHTHPTSPWPDEAIKQHLTDPIQRAGFKKINGRWTLPLDVGVHSSLGPQGGHGSLSPIGGGNDPSSLAEMLMKQAGWKNNFQSVLDRVNAAGQSPNYIDRVTQKLADKLGPAAAKAFRSALTDLDVQSGRIDPRWMTQAFKNVSYIPEGHTSISTNHHHDNNNRGGGIRVILDRRHYDQQASYQEDYGRGF